MKRAILLFLFSGTLFAAESATPKVENACTTCSHQCTRAYEHQAGLCMPYIGNTLDKFPKACQEINNTFNDCQSKCPCASN